MSFDKLKFESFPNEREEGKEIYPKKDLEFRKFLAQQISLPEDKWDEEFKNYIEEKYYKEEIVEIPEISPEEQRRLTFQRYLKGLDLTLEDLRNKKVLDLGCGKGEFLKECFDRGITQEVYGLDLKIKPETIEDKYKNHFFKGSFEKRFPVKDLDLIIAVGAIEAPINERDKRDPTKTLNFALNSLKENGEIRIYPLRKAPPKSELKGIEFSYKKWLKILNELSSRQIIEYTLKPIDIRVSGKKPNVWLEEVLIIKKRPKSKSEGEIK